MRIFGSLIFVFSLMFVACQPGGVGDPCDPVSCPAPPEGAEAWKRCDWLPTEIYLEGRSLQCRTRVCMVFRVDSNYQNPDMSGQFQGPYCTRPCGDNATNPDCPPDYCCMKIVTQGQSSPTGTYCVKKDDLIRTGGGGQISRDDCENVLECCSEGSTAGSVECSKPKECNF